MDGSCLTLSICFGLHNSCKEGSDSTALLGSWKLWTAHCCPELAKYLRALAACRRFCT